MISQFSIVLANLDSTVGHEQRGVRPCLIVQTNAGIERAMTLLVVPFTSNVERLSSFEVSIMPSEQNGLTVVSRVKFDQMRVVDRSRIIKQLGQLESSYYSKMEEGLDFIFDRNQRFA